MAVLLNWSLAVTVPLMGTPAVAEEGRLTTKCVAALAFTVIVPEVPVIEGVTVSVAVTVWLPAVTRVKPLIKVPTPAVRVKLGGRMTPAPESVLVKCTVPVYPVAVLLNWSLAVTDPLNATPAVAEEGALTTKCVAAAALTATFPEVPVIVEFPVSVAVTV